MIAQELLDILVCPVSKQPVRLLNAEELSRLNAALAGGSLKSVGGGDVQAPLEAALIRQDGQVVYPVRAEIPVMLVSDSLDLNAAGISISS